MERTVSVILANPKAIAESNCRRQLRVAAYCRVSTDQEEQQSSYQAQIDYYTDKIAKNSEWTLAGIFADEGISGTSAKNRAQFLRLMSLCKQGKIDMVLTKSISRFSRNTLDCLGYIRMLKEKRIPIIFEKEGINTMQMASEMTISLLGSFAQAESESLSKNVTWGKRQSFKNGNVSINYAYFLGYEKGEDGLPKIVPEQAEIVKNIYRFYLAGYSVVGIKRELEKQGALTATGNAEWTVNAIRSMLRNEKYIGDVLLQKTYVSDFLTKKNCKNNGELPQYYVSNHHVGIIEKDVFNRVQEEMARRSSKRKVADKNVTTEQGKYSSKYALTEILVCGNCATQYRRVVWSKRGKKKSLWRCISRLEYGTKYCSDSPTIEESVLHNAIIRAINLLASDKDELISTIRESLCLALKGYGDNDNPYMIESRIKELNSDMLDLVQLSAKSGSDCKKYDEQFKSIADETRRLQEILVMQKSQKAEDTKTSSHMNELFNILESEALAMTEFDNTLVKQLIDTIKILSKNKILIIFNGGFEMEQTLCE